MAKAKTTSMFNPDNGKTGDIHPDEVENMKLAGWRLAKDTPKKKDDVDATDQELRDFIEHETGDKPHHRAGRETLVAKYVEICKD